MTCPLTPPPDLEEQWLGMWPQEALQAAAQWGYQQCEAEYERLALGLIVPPPEGAVELDNAD